LGVGFPGKAAVGAEGQALILVGACTGIDSHQGRLAIYAETAGIVMVYHHTPREGHHPVLDGNGHRKMLPVHQIFAFGMAPAHIAPIDPLRIVLEEEMVFAGKVHHPIGVVNPVPERRKVVFGPVQLLAGLRHGNKTCQ